jgi:hypothetical protein
MVLNLVNAILNLSADVKAILFHENNMADMGTISIVILYSILKNRNG